MTYDTYVWSLRALPIAAGLIGLALAWRRK
jgi:hypothetical protein